ncbi:MAG: peptide deformylase [Gammaproteobacteria bacterium]|nr:peptide deformylase [Gammaproteobacteria bacterium]
MSLLTVLHYPDPGLRKRAQTVTSIDESIRILARDMLETMYAQRGIGLAATQVSIPLRVVVMDLSEDRNAPQIFINPEILTTEGIGEGEEGCLSVPGFFDKVPRAQRITFQYQDLDGRLIAAPAEALLAICMQHEIDHLNGKLFIDYLSRLKRQRLRKKIGKAERDPAPVL